MSSQRYRVFSYHHLDQKFTNSNCTVEEVDLPDIQRSNIVSISQAQDPGPLYYHTSERLEIVEFSVTYIPHDNVSGRKLLAEVKTIVEDVLTKTYKPEVAIIQLVRNGKPEKETRINDCIITGGEIILDGGDYTYIKFTLQGLLDAKY